MPEEPHILFLDIETLPAKAWVWERYETNVIEIIEEWRILSFSAKWKNGEHVTLIDHRTDKSLVKILWKILDKADIVVAQNGDKFDIKKINSRFLFYGLTPPSPYRTVDTLKVSRRKFGLLSNKLDDIGEYTGLGRKIKTDKELWLKCAVGDKKALRDMAKYNAQDVLLLERVYTRYLPWIDGHPNLGMWKDKTVCPKCASGNLISQGFRKTQTSKYRQFSCKDCGAWGHVRVNEQDFKVAI